MSVREMLLKQLTEAMDYRIDYLSKMADRYAEVGPVEMSLKTKGALEESQQWRKSMSDVIDDKGADPTYVVRLCTTTAQIEAVLNTGYDAGYEVYRMEQTAAQDYLIILKQGGKKWPVAWC